MRRAAGAVDARAGTDETAAIGASPERTAVAGAVQTASDAALISSAVDTLLAEPALRAASLTHVARSIGSESAIRASRDRAMLATVWWRHAMASGAESRVTAMRVYLGSDHAGYELKQAIIEHLKAGGHEPIDCGAYTYDAEDDYPAFCIAAAVRTVADPDSLGIVLGGSGNGEQIAANKVPGARCALAWSVETASLARQHNNAQLIGIGGRMHTVDEALAIVDAFLTTPWSEAERHQRRIDILAEYEKHPRRAAGARRAGVSRARGPHAAPAGPAASAPLRPARPVRGVAVRRAGSPTARRWSTAGVLRKADAWGKHLFHHYDGGRVVHIHLGLYGTFTEFAPTPDAADPVGQVRMRMVGAEYGTDLRGPTVCEVIDEAEVADVVARLGPDPLRRDADPARAWARITKSRRPIGALLMDQTVIAGRRQRLPQRAAVPAPHRSVPAGHATSATTSSTRCGPTWSR